MKIKKVFAVGVTILVMAGLTRVYLASAAQAAQPSFTAPAAKITTAVAFDGAVSAGIAGDRNLAESKVRSFREFLMPLLPLALSRIRMRWQKLRWNRLRKIPCTSVIE